MSTTRPVTPPIKSLREILEGNLPYASSVYIVFVREEGRIHIFSSDVSTKYQIAKGQRCGADNMRSDVRKYFDKKIFEWNVSYEDDLSGFYNGLGSRQMGFMRSVCKNGLDQEHDDWENAIYVNFVDRLSDDKVSSVLGSLGAIEEDVHCGLRLCEREPNYIEVTMNDETTKYTIVKVSRRSVYFGDETFQDGYEFLGVGFSPKMSSNDINRIRSKCLDLLRVVINDERNMTRLSEDTYKMICTALDSDSPWAVVTHSHETIE